MNSTEDISKRQQTSDNMPVFFTGLTESVKSEPKIPLLCILCGSSIANNSKNKDDSLKNTQNHNGCENCTRNFNNLKEALSLLSKISSLPSTPPEVLSSQSNATIQTVKRKSLLPHPVQPSTSEDSSLISHTNKSLEYKTEKEEYTFTPNHTSSDLKRKSNFNKSDSKKPRTDCNTSGINFIASPSENECDKLSKSIWKLFFENKQTQSVYEKKMALRDKLHEILLTSFPRCGLYVVGSSMTGLGGNSSDMDMCLMLTDDEVDQEKEATNILHIVRSVFLEYNFLRDVQVIYAKVPIIRLTDSVSGIEVDLNVNNAVGIRNTQLLSSYARIDKRLPPLVLLVKIWARFHNINDAKNNSLSSYSLVLMVIHYLQYACQPPVLPCLQELQPDKYQPHSNVRKLALIEDLPDFTSENVKDLGDLFMGFLNYFAHKFDYFRSVMSVRLGTVIPKEDAMNNTFCPKNKRAHWKWVCIEEPFDLTNTACAVFKPQVFRYIKEVFVKSWDGLTKSSNLNSVMRVIH